MSRTPDGRVVEKVKVPADLLEALKREAARRGQRVERLAGDLIAQELPRALAEAAQRVLAMGQHNLHIEMAPGSRPAPSGSFTLTLDRSSVDDQSEDRNAGRGRAG